MKIKSTLTILILIIFSNIYAQTNLPVLKTNNSQLSFRIGNEYHKDAWTIMPHVNPDILEIPISKKTTVVFISEEDSLEFIVKPENIYNFTVIKNDTIFANTQIKAIKKIQKAIFSESYKKKHDKKTFVEVPDVYELVNVLFALTPSGKKNTGIVKKDIPYYKSVIQHFDKYKNEKVVSVIDSLFAQNLIYHCELKLDAYSFYFNKKGKIRKKKEYNITSRESENTLLPYISLIQDFTDKTDFLIFFEKHEAFYQSQINFYSDSINVKKMNSWLFDNFPNANCNSIKIIFSPLSYRWQNANTLYDNNFTEVFAFVNFPYFHSDNLSQQANILRRGNFIFTELNHNFLNSQRHIYLDEINNAIQDLSKWLDTSKPAKNYGNPISCFDEYMNWGLVSLWYIENAPKNELEKLIAENDDYMTNQRGFIKFKEFDSFLIDIYLNKKKDETISDLYPKLINWFNDTEKASH